MPFAANYRTALCALKVEVVLIVLYAVLVKYEDVEMTSTNNATNDSFDNTDAISIYPYDYLSHVHAQSQ